MSMNNQNQQGVSHASYDLTGIRELKHISQDVNKSVAEVKTAMYGNRLVYPYTMATSEQEPDGWASTR